MEDDHDPGPYNTAFTCYPDVVEQLFDRIGHLKNMAFYMIDVTRNKLVRVTDSVELICGYPLRRLIDHEKGITFLKNRIHPLDFSLNREEGDWLPACKSEVVTHEFRFLHPTHDWIWLETLLIYMDLDEESDFVLGTLKDITLRKRKENFLWTELRKREHNFFKLKTLLNAFRSITMDSELGREGDHELLHILRHQIDKHLSRRELEVLQLVANGYSSKQLADKLNISNHTAISHRKNLMEKFNVRNTAELIKKASKSHLIH